MRNLFNKATGTAIAIAAAALLSSGSANANHNPIPAEGHATVIHDEPGCSIIGTDWGGGEGNILSTVDSHLVLTPSGVVKGICFFDAPIGAEPDKTVVREGFDCVLPGGLATSSHSISTRNGRIILNCSGNPPE